MFCCCFRPSEGSGPRRTKNRVLGRFWRRWVRPLVECLWPFSRRNPQDEQEAGFTVHELCTAKSDIPGYLEKLVSYLATAVKNGDFLFVCTFLGIYQRFGSTWQVLDLIMKRYASFQPDSEEDQQTKNAICFFLGLWMAKLPGDFCDSPDLDVLNQLMNYVQVNMPSSALDIHIQELLSRLENQESIKAIPKKEEACVSGLSRAAAPEHPAQYAAGMPEALDPRSACTEVPQEDLLHEEEPEFMEPYALARKPAHTQIVTCIEQDLSTKSNTKLLPDVDADIPAPGQVFLSTYSQIGDPEPVSPLPRVDI